MSEINQEALLAYIVGSGSLTLDKNCDEQLLKVVGSLLSQGFLVKKKGIFYPTSLASNVIGELLCL